MFWVEISPTHVPTTLLLFKIELESYPYVALRKNNATLDGGRRYGMGRAVSDELAVARAGTVAAAEAEAGITGGEVWGNTGASEAEIRARV